MSQERTPVRVEPYAGLTFVPRSEYGEMCQLVEISGTKDGTNLGVGFARFTKARIPWTIHYDEVLIGIEGLLKVHAGGGVHTIGPKDSLWLPKGTELIYEADYALTSYAVYPLDWAERMKKKA